MYLNQQQTQIYCITFVHFIVYVKKKFVSNLDIYNKCHILGKDVLKISVMHFLNIPRSLIYS